jgi:hypothetical protein
MRHLSSFLTLSVCFILVPSQNGTFVLNFQKNSAFCSGEEIEVSDSSDSDGNISKELVVPNPPPHFSSWEFYTCNLSTRAVTTTASVQSATYMVHNGG